MADIGQPFSDSVPAVGTSGTAYASTINSILQECIDRLSVAVPSGSIAAATSDLDLNNHALTNVSYVGLYDQSTVPAGAPYGRLATYGGDLYFVGTSGVIQLTRAGSINITGVAGIGGDYGGVDPAGVNFETVSNVYRFYSDEAALEWAILQARQITLTDQTAGLSVQVRPSTSIAANYSLVLPTNDPASGVSLLSMNSSGELAHGVTVSNAEAFSNTVTFSADPVLSGSTNIRHGERTLQVGLAATAFGPGPVRVEVSPTTVSGILTAPVDTTTINIPLTLEVGWRIKSIRATGSKSTAGTATLALRHKATGTSVVVVDDNTTTTSGDYDVSVTGLTHTVLASNKYFITLVLPKSTDTLEMVELIYDVVA